MTSIHLKGQPMKRLLTAAMLVLLLPIAARADDAKPNTATKPGARRIG